MIPTLHERLRAGEAGDVMRRAPRSVKKAPVQAGRKPWSERERAPWGDGDPDGEDNDAYETPPGEEGDAKPNPNPDGDRANMRGVVGAAAMDILLSNPDASRALMAIEARLGEICLYLPTAMGGLPPGDARKRLAFLQRLI